MRLTSICILVFIAASYTGQAFGAITFVQSKVNASCGSTTSCTISGLTATTAGNLIIIAVEFFQSSTSSGTITSSTGESTTSSGYNCTNTSIYADISYSLSATGGATSITVNATHNIYSAIVAEYSYPGNTWRLDTGGSRNSATCSGTTANSPALTTTLSNDVVVMMAAASNSFNVSPYTVTGSGWTTPLVSGVLGGAAYDHALNVAAGFNTLAAFTNSTSGGAYCASALAFGPAPKGRGYPIIQ